MVVLWPSIGLDPGSLLNLLSDFSLEETEAENLPPYPSEL